MKHDMKTSYYKSNLIDMDNCVSISQYPPKWFPCVKVDSLVPSRSLLMSYKDGEVSWREYIETFQKETLSNLDPKEIYTSLSSKTLLCYEKPGEFCHREIVRKWLVENGYDAVEVHTRVYTDSLDNLLEYLSEVDSDDQKRLYISTTDKVVATYCKVHNISHSLYPTDDVELIKYMHDIVIDIKGDVNV